ncbi:hypothetical protein PGIGA_G00134460 [Pangasianodon gigas]|uniref:Uncharacterized protein n=1 Tax=Pangasianodon gigas TaxID=30993 RepID=A0ACC5XJU3_PANGG|nr:hypothetical protein [Pangasianodon gigas]
MRTALLCLFAVLLTATICKSTTNPCVCIKTRNVSLHASRIKNYYMQQSGLCHITAVVLKTVKGHTVCADPKNPRVIKAMKLVDARRRTGSTTASPVSTASERTVITTGGLYNIS